MKDTTDTKKIVVDTTADPATDPRSQDFNAEEWRQASQGAERELRRQINDTKTKLSDITFRLCESFREIGDNPEELARAAYSIWHPVREALQQLFENPGSLLALWLELADLEEYLKPIMKRPAYQGLTLDDLVESGFDDANGGVIKGSPLDKLLKAARRAAGRAAEESPFKSNGTPKYYTSANTALSNALQALDNKGEVIGGGDMDIPVMNIGKPNEITIFVNAYFDMEEAFEGKPFPEYDRAVHDAIGSLFLDSQRRGQEPEFTASQIYRTVTHKTETEKVAPGQQTAIETSMEKMRHIFIDINATDQLRKLGVVNGTDGHYNNYLLSYTEKPKLVGGKVVKVYRFDMPILLQYAKDVNELFTVRGEILDIKEVRNGVITPTSISNTRNRIEIKSYLLRRVEIMRRDEKRARDSYAKYKKECTRSGERPQKTLDDFRKQSRVILLEKVFQAAHIASANRKTEARTYISQVMDYWKAMKYISSGNQRSREKGRSTDAIIISFYNE